MGMEEYLGQLVSIETNKRHFKGILDKCDENNGFLILNLEDKQEEVSFDEILSLNLIEDSNPSKDINDKTYKVNYEGYEKKESNSLESIQSLPQKSHIKGFDTNEQKTFFYNIFEKYGPSEEVFVGICSANLSNYINDVHNAKKIAFLVADNSIFAKIAFQLYRILSRTNEVNMIYIASPNRKMIQDLYYAQKLQNIKQSSLPETYDLAIILSEGAFTTISKKVSSKSYIFLNSNQKKGENFFSVYFGIPLKY